MSVPPAAAGSSIAERVAALDLDVVGVAATASGDDLHSLAAPALEERRVVDVGEAGHRVGEVGGAVDEVDHGLAGQLACLGEGGDAALGAADHGAGDVELGGELVAAGDDELRRQLDLAHVAVDPLLELGDHRLGRAADPVFEALGRLGRGRQLGAGDEEVVLEAQDVGGELGLASVTESAGHAELGAGLVERAVGLGATVVLGDAAAVPERGGAVVALLGVDLDHGAILRRAVPVSLRPAG